MNDARHAVETIADAAQRLRNMAAPEESVRLLINAAGAAAFRLKAGPGRPALAGLIGCTGAGKSTIFNSIAGRDISETSWKAHNTRGPIALMSRSALDRLTAAEQADGPGLLPQFKRIRLDGAADPRAAGSIDSLSIAAADDSTWPGVMLFDLPDINTTLAREEQLIALELLTWLDAAIFVIDEETLFHRDYDAPARLARKLGQQRFSALNHRGRDAVDTRHPDIQSVQRLFGVDRLYVLSELKGKERFDNEAEFARLKRDALACKPLEGVAPLMKLMAPAAKSLLADNARRIDLFDRVERALTEGVQNALRGLKPIPLQRIMHDDVLQALDHLGLKRFAVSNIYQFLRRTATTGSVTRSFQLAFGGSRGAALGEMLSFDLDKLCVAAGSRIDAGLQQLQTAIKPVRDDERLAPFAAELRPAAEPDESARRVRLRELLDGFEGECKEILDSDTLQNTLKNDPVSSVLVVAMMAADLVVIPGFGSFALVPSAIKYVPMGRFERIKRNFQRAVDDLVRDELNQAARRVSDARARFVIDKDDPLYAALEACAAHD